MSAYNDIGEARAEAERVATNAAIDRGWTAAELDGVLASIARAYDLVSWWGSFWATDVGETWAEQAAEEFWANLAAEASGWTVAGADKLRAWIQAARVATNTGSANAVNTPYDAVDAGAAAVAETAKDIKRGADRAGSFLTSPLTWLGLGVLALGLGGRR